MLGFKEADLAGRAAAILAALAIAATPAIAQAASGGVGTDGQTSGSGKSEAGVFPVKGKHTYGDGLGAGRGHQGQDLLAKCGKPVVSAQPGKVKVKDYQASGAGNYVVVKGKGPRYDYVYMHMLKRLNVREGERIEAGEQIGRVGSTGSSTACHLHFEMWTGPGWYSGGKVANPTPFLKKWDR